MVCVSRRLQGSKHKYLSNRVPIFSAGASALTGEKKETGNGRAGIGLEGGWKREKKSKRRVGTARSVTGDKSATQASRTDHSGRVGGRGEAQGGGDMHAVRGLTC